MEAQNKFKTVIICFFALIMLAAAVGCSGVNKTNPLASNTNERFADELKIITKNGEQSLLNKQEARNQANNGGDVLFKPVVNIFSEQSSVGVLGEIALRAEAIDPAGGPVDIKWSSQQGKIVNVSGSTALWQAPDCAAKTSISCTATDVRGVSTTAVFNVDVVGNLVYQLKVTAEKCSLIAPSSSSSDSDSPTVPIKGAKVSFDALKISEVTNSNGIVTLSIDPLTCCASDSEVVVSYRDLSVKYSAKLKEASQTSFSDSINFYPGYNGVTTAIAKGDSFANRLGTVEVCTSENCMGNAKPIGEAQIDIGRSIAFSECSKGRAVISSNVPLNSNSSLQISKVGYQEISGYTVPIALNGTTLVNATLTRAGTIPQAEAAISYIKPYSGQKDFSITGPIKIGFGQAMQKETIFDELAVIAENDATKKLTAINSATISTLFNAVWKNSTTLCLYPKTPLLPKTKYGFTIASFNAKATDGRILKSYGGTKIEFSTRTDPEPKITSVNPANNATDVSCYGPYIIEFNTPMNPESLYDGFLMEFKCPEEGKTFTFDGSSIKSLFMVEWLNDNRVLKLVSIKTLHPKTTYQMRLIRCGLTSESGKELKNAEHMRSFTTGRL